MTGYPDDLASEVSYLYLAEPSDDTFAHIGMYYNSGRYPRGSGKDAYQRSVDFANSIAEMRRQRIPETVIAKQFGLSVAELRDHISYNKAQMVQYQRTHVLQMKDRGMSVEAIAERMKMAPSTVRDRLKEANEPRATKIEKTASVLKGMADEYRYVDVGKGVDVIMGLSPEGLRTATNILKQEGYEVHSDVRIQQMDAKGQFTPTKVLTAPGVTKSELQQNRDKVHAPGIACDLYGTTSSITGIQKPTSVDSKRIKVRWAEDGGGDYDGIIHLRPGVEDLNLGRSKYAQVRIAVDGTHYLKGVAMYDYDLPKGVDIVVNSPKKRSDRKHDAFKEMKDDPANPFKSTVRQQYYLDKTGKKRLSALNIVRQEGEWDEWSDTLSPQFLAKQDLKFAKRQLDRTARKVQQDYEEILSLTNPVVRQRMLHAFADKCESRARDLKALPLPNQTTQVLLPLKSLTEKEAFAPNYKTGDTIALVRFPHAGPFEIPILRVNNRNEEGRKRIGLDTKDAVAINPRTANKLSGADFDGDTVVTIKITPSARIKSLKTLEGLKNFDPKERYPGYPGMRVMRNTQQQMGMATNLLQDMQIRGASIDEVARAVRHSMVVIDAEKHKLDYRKSERENGIAELRRKYQDGGGPSTLITRANSLEWVPKRKARSYTRGGPFDKKTGERVYEVEPPYTDKKGRTKFRTEGVPRMDLVRDAHKLSTGTPIEGVYADYANTMKRMANQARLEAIKPVTIRTTPEAKIKYRTEVETLRASVKRAQAASVYERAAHRVVEGQLKMRVRDLGITDKKDIEKEKRILLAAARSKVRDNKPRYRIELTDKTWEAIQSGAVSRSLMEEVFDNTDRNALKAWAIPRNSSTKLRPADISRAKAMFANGASTREVASALGVSTSTISSEVHGKIKS